MQEPVTSQQRDSGKQEYLTRRERRQLAREQRGSGGGTPKWVRSVALWGGVVLVVALIGWGMVVLSRNTPLPTGDGTLADAVTEQDNTLGPADAPVTLVEYSDFQCPACAAFHSVVKQALAEPELEGKILFVYRSFPLTNIHKNAQLAAQAAQAAALQGKFWEMHDALFEGQQKWANMSSTGAGEQFKEYAASLGLDVEQFSDDIDSSAVRDAVREQSDSAERSGVNSTPTFFINGAQMPQPNSYEQFKQFLLDAVYANS